MMISDIQNVVSICITKSLLHNSAVEDEYRKISPITILQRYCHKTCLVFIIINYFWWSHNEKEYISCFVFLSSDFFFQLLLQKLISFMTYSFLFELISCYFGFIHMFQLKSWLFWRSSNGTKNLYIDILSTLPFRSEFYCSYTQLLFCKGIIKITTDLEIM